MTEPLRQDGSIDQQLLAFEFVETECFFLELLEQHFELRARRTRNFIVLLVLQTSVRRLNDLLVNPLDTIFRVEERFQHASPVVLRRIVHEQMRIDPPATFDRLVQSIFEVGRRHE